MKPILLILTGIFVTGQAIGQLYQGPASGSIAGGVTVTTDDFSIAPEGPAPLPMVPNKFNVPLLDPPADLPAPLGGEDYNASEYDPAESSLLGIPPINLASFQGIPQTNSIPPDPHCAVGPNHIIATVNTSFRISDKQGNTLKTITGSAWFSTTLGAASPFDPQIMYDNFNGRWIMLWDHLGASTAYWLISVSDDDDPLGTWYNWAVPAHLNGATPSGNWGDYPGIGFDQDALYVVSREFSFSGFYQYPKLRIIGTQQLYQNNAGPVAWTDLWAIEDLSGFIHDGLRPTVVLSDPVDYFLLAPTTFGGSNTYFILYRLSNPLTAPVMTAAHVTAASWVPAPNANQLGGGTLLVEAGGSRMRHAAVYKDSSIWGSHSVANGSYSSIRYVRINTINNTMLEDARLGATGYWHYYPALMVDDDDNVAITFSRSSTTEYIGAGMMWRLAGDPAGLEPATIFKEGEANYQQDFGSGRNRWGDYMSIARDPAQPNSFWMLTEYAESPANIWSTWWLHTRLVPFDDQHVVTYPGSHDFGLREVGVEPETLDISVFNAGTPDLMISNISNSNPSYTLTGLPGLPITLSTFDSIAFSVVFDPVSHGDAVDSIIITSNDPANPTAPIYLDGRGIDIEPALAGVMYAASGTADGNLYAVNPSTGAATLIGPLGINELQGLAVRPSNNELYGIAIGSVSSTLYRVAPSYGDALTKTTVPVGNMRAIAFSETGELYGATTAGQFYEIDPETGDATLLGTAPGIIYSGLTQSPTSGLFYGSVRGVVGRDRIFLVNPANGDTTLLGVTGDGQVTPSLAVGPNGVLYGLKGVGATENSLIMIDTITAAGTLVGLSGVSGLSSIAIRTDSMATSVSPIGDGLIPEVYSLSQNYPNPFNPTTEIVFALPEQSDVTLSIYNLLGQEVRVLVRGTFPAGTHKATWNGLNESGNAMASGMYFYRIEARGNSPSPFTEARKMLLLR
jgi:hypothetical protein